MFGKSGPFLPLICSINKSQTLQITCVCRASNSLHAFKQQYCLPAPCDQGCATPGAPTCSEGLHAGLYCL